VPNNTT